MKRYLLLMGAYERDNFGDILFNLVTRTLLKNIPVLSASTITNFVPYGASHVIPSISMKTISDSHRADIAPFGMLVVGGEMLSADCAVAMHCLEPQDLQARHLQGPQELSEALVAQTFMESQRLAYFPGVRQMKERFGNDIYLALNSVGGGDDPEKIYTDLGCSEVDKINYVSVRNKKSLEKLAGCRNKVSKQIYLNPDLVHLLAKKDASVFHASLLDSPVKIRGCDEYIVFQSNQRLLDSVSAEVVTESLIEVLAQRKNCGLIFLPAGLAPHHDTLAGYTLVARQIRAKRSDVYIRIMQDRSIKSQVATIAHALCYIGTSLHGRIVSTAYKTPTVSLLNDKVAEYCKTWSLPQSQRWNVAFAELASAVNDAIKESPAIIAECSERLAIHAEEGFEILRRDIASAANANDLASDRDVYGLENELLRQEIATTRNRYFDVVAQHDASF